MYVLVRVAVDMVVPVGRGPPERPSLQGEGSHDGEEESHGAGCLKAVVSEEAVESYVGADALELGEEKDLEGNLPPRVAADFLRPRLGYRPEDEDGMHESRVDNKPHRTIHADDTVEALSCLGEADDAVPSRLGRKRPQSARKVPQIAPEEAEFV